MNIGGSIRVGNPHAYTVLTMLGSLLPLKLTPKTLNEYCSLVIRPNMVKLLAS